MNPPALLAALFAAVAPLAALAQPWPAQPVRLMVGFPPGGTTDLIARLAANELSERAAAFIRAEQEKWGRIIREAGIKIN